jgi:hypothetical protein
MMVWRSIPSVTKILVYIKNVNQYFSLYISLCRMHCISLNSKSRSSGCLESSDDGTTFFQFQVRSTAESRSWQWWWEHEVPGATC